jgi:tetratricopeptide (TPR) repeat protein
MPREHNAFWCPRIHARVGVFAAAVALALAAAPTFAQNAPNSGSRAAQGANQGQGGQGENGNAPPSNIDVATAKALNTAIEALNMEKYAEAQAAIGTLNLEKLSPYERSKVEQILFNISYAQEKYEEARGHLQKSIDAGGLNEQEISQARYQFAQLYMTEEKWKEGAAALEEWFKTAMNPNSAAYYLLAVAYYQMEQFDKSLPNAQKAIELSEKPQESWLQLLLALYLQKEQYKDAIPLLVRLVEAAPDKKTYWMQLSAVYGQVEDYKNALGIMQLAYGAGLVTEDSEIRRLADLLLFNDVPYRGGQVLQDAIEKKQVNVDDKLYEKLASCWIAAGELDKAIDPLQKGADISSSGDMFVRLGEVQIQRQDWDGAKAAIQRGIEKGQLKDAGSAQLLMGIVYFNEKKLGDAKTWFERAQQSPRHKSMAENYLKVIGAQQAS